MGWKKAKLTLPHQSGTKDDPQNCWPILVLPVASKVLERLIHKQLADYFDEHILLRKAQSGFRMHSTETAVTYLAEEILINMGARACHKVCLHWPNRGFQHIRAWHWHHGLSQDIVYLSYKTEILIIKFPIMAFPAKSWVISPYFMRVGASLEFFLP